MRMLSLLLYMVYMLYMASHCLSAGHSNQQAQVVICTHIVQQGLPFTVQVIGVLSSTGQGIHDRSYMGPGVSNHAQLPQHLRRTSSCLRTNIKPCMR
jgi:hypothetical protein